MRPKYTDYDTDYRNERLEEDQVEILKVGTDAPFSSYNKYGVEMNGLLSPDGLLHKCRYEGHEHLAHKLGFRSSSGPEAAGYVKLQYASFFKRLVDGDGWTNGRTDTCTQAQLNRMVKWAEQHNAPVEFIDDLYRYWKVSE